MFWFCLALGAAGGAGAGAMAFAIASAGWPTLAAALVTFGLGIPLAIPVGVALGVAGLSRSLCLHLRLPRSTTG